ncbi:MAG: hypothetical protein JRF21_10150 [Deltaproteobacteria bacterium]|nr:hypothetical protein [Deltaproteobacteria bacterium]
MKEINIHFRLNTVACYHTMFLPYHGFYKRKDLPAGRQAGLKTISKGLNVVQMGLLLLCYGNYFIAEKNSFGSLSPSVFSLNSFGLTT